MTEYRERPKYRILIENLLFEHPGTELMDLVSGFYFDFGQKTLINHEMKIQAKKMYQENNFRNYNKITHNTAT